MNFIDRTGHIFSIKSYNEYPIGYEYEETPYKFWFDTERGYKLSVDNYYFKPIRIVTKVSNIDQINVNIKIENSKLFYLIDSTIIDNQLLTIKNINNSIELFESDITSCQELNYNEKIVCKLDEDEESETYNQIIVDIENSDFKGCLVDEGNEIQYGYEKYYTHSNIPYTGEILTWNDLDENIAFADGEFDRENPENESKLFGILENHYIELTEKTKYVIVTDDNRENCIDIQTIKDFYLINTFYVVVNSKEPGIWSTNVLIQVNDEYCPVTVSAEIIDEQEELIINGKNIGVSLPKEIVRAIYSGNYNIDVADEKLYYQKLKEYLINFMKIKGELGNYRSAITSLKWFEWGDKLTISKLIKNDNRIQRQYVKDFFDIINDNLYSYQLFKETSLLSIEFKLTEDGEQEKQNMHHYFWGEAKPEIYNQFNNVKDIKYDEQEYAYKRGYFEFTFSDLGLKLAALKYYYEKYFLPLYIRIHNIYMNQKVYANDIKYITKTLHSITANPIFITNNQIITDNENNIQDIVINNGYNIVYFNRYYKKNFNAEYSENNLLYVDENFNEFTHYLKDFVETDDKTYYTINDTCLRIPISFPHKLEDSEYYDVTLILSQYINPEQEQIVDNSNLKQVLKTRFTFIQTDDNQYQSIILYPKIINELNEFDSLYWLNNKFRIDLIVNNKPYEFIFTTKMPEFNIEMGTLHYLYDDKFRQLSSIEDNHINFNACMYLPNLVNVNNMHFSEDITNLSDNLINYINSNYKENIKLLNEKYLNICHLLKLTDLDGNEIPYIDNENNPMPSKITIDNLELFAISNQNIELYQNFFNNDGSYNFNESLININGYQYDLYLMHDFEKWYVVLISKNCIDDNILFKFGNNTRKIRIGDYILLYERSDKKFLLNRYYYKPSEGINQFTKNDLIVTSLKNNDKLCFKLTNSKWIIKSLSLGMNNINTVTSNTELAIISIPNKYSEYEQGYYSLTVNYSVDDYINHSYEKKIQFKITA